MSQQESNWMKARYLGWQSLPAPFLLLIHNRNRKEGNPVCATDAQTGFSAKTTPAKTKPVARRC